MSDINDQDNSFEDYLAESIENDQNESLSLSTPKQKFKIVKQEEDPQNSTLPNTHRKNQQLSDYEESFESESFSASRKPSQQYNKAKISIHA